MKRTLNRKEGERVVGGNVRKVFKLRAWKGSSMATIKCGEPDPVPEKKCTCETDPANCPAHPVK